MAPNTLKIRKAWFSARIFISLTIVVVISLISFLEFRRSPTTLELAGKCFGLSDEISLKYGYLVIALMVLMASLIRMWAGSILSSGTVMAFKIQNKNLMISGPYNLVRNPIYFADLVAFTSLSLCLKPVGILIPVLICFHYYQLIKYEQEMLLRKFSDEYKQYIDSVPALIPGLGQIKKIPGLIKSFRINFDGFRHNAQYILFIPGLIVAAQTGKFIHAILIALPAVIDWAVIHTFLGLRNDSTSGNKDKENKKIAESTVFRDILYAQCWEDPEMDRAAFKIRPGDVVFSITSGGCNALTFLLDNPKEVICLDLNKYQNYLLSLKINAFRILSHHETLELFGIIPSGRRWELYKRINPVLPTEEQIYWRRHRRAISKGIIHCGRYERYLHLLKKIFRIIVGKKVINDLFNLTSINERSELFTRKWNNKRWKIFCRIFLSRTFASLLFDKSFYKYLEPSFSFEKYYQLAVKKAVTELPVQENYFLAYILFGNFYNGNLPPYLKEENYNLIGDRIDRIKMFTSGCLKYFESLPEGFISKFNFTNIFEWMSMPEFSNLMKETIRVAKNNAVITYRNHLVTRNRPECFADQIIPDQDLAAELHKRDRSFIYKAYVVEHIKKNQCHF